MSITLRESLLRWSLLEQIHQGSGDPANSVSELGVPVDYKLVRTGLTVSGAATKTICFTRKNFGCIRVPVWALKTEFVRIAPAVGRPC